MARCSHHCRQLGLLTNMPRKGHHDNTKSNKKGGKSTPAATAALSG